VTHQPLAGPVAVATVAAVVAGALAYRVGVVTPTGGWVAVGIAATAATLGVTAAALDD
jgi:hypothetical protein